MPYEYKKYRQYGQIKSIDLLTKMNIPTELIHWTEDANCSKQFLTRYQAELMKNPLVGINITEGLDHSFRRTTSDTSLMVSMHLPIDAEYYSVLDKSINRVIRDSK